jgi:HK97 family phage portal protein
MLVDRVLSVFGRKSLGGVFNGPLGHLVAEYLREGGSTAVSEDQAMRLAAVNACVRLNSHVLASLSLHLYRWREDGRGKDRVLTGNTLIGILKRPNAWQTGMEFREQVQASALLRGNGYAWINWSKQLGSDAAGRRLLVDRVMELIPLHPDRMTVARDSYRQPPRYWITDDAGQKVEFPAEEIFHLRGLSSDGMTGRGVIEDARASLSVGINAERYANDFWANDATPGVTLLYDQPLSKERAKDERDRWDEAHAKKGRRTAVLSGGVKLERLTLTAEDSQFLETRKFQRGEIAGLFLTPPHMIGDTDRSTSWGTGIEQQFIGWITCRLRPDAVRWEQALNRALVVRDDRFFLEHSFDSLMRGDSAARSTFYHNAITDGWLTRNEVRSMENRNPIDGLDDPLTPLNMGGVTPGGATPGGTPADDRAGASQAAGDNGE